MTYKIRLTKTAEQHLTQWRKTGQTKMLLKIISLFEELRQHPRFGTGQMAGKKEFTTWEVFRNELQEEGYFD